MLLVQDGWCVQFETPQPLVNDSFGRIHTWDVRADWRSPSPQCSAILTRPYREFKEFPAWFFNMPPTDNNLPGPEDRPPYAALDMTVTGYLDTDDPGELIIETGETMKTTLVIDGSHSRARRAFAASAASRARPAFRAGEVKRHGQQVDVRAAVERIADRHHGVRVGDDGDSVGAGSACARRAVTVDADARGRARHRLDRRLSPSLARAFHARLRSRGLRHRRLAGHPQPRLRHDAVGGLVDDRARTCDLAAGCRRRIRR